MSDANYDDGEISCDDGGVTIRRYYPWGGAKHIRYSAIKDVQSLPLAGINAARRWRIWGSGDFRHWWNLDPHRPKKQRALVLDLGRYALPTITQDDPDAVERIITGHLAG